MGPLKVMFTCLKKGSLIMVAILVYAWSIFLAYILYIALMATEHAFIIEKKYI